MLSRVLAGLFLLLLMISCSSDDDVIQVNDPAIEINFDKVEVSFDYEDFLFTALLDTIVLDLDVSYLGETGSDELLVLWSVDNTNVESQRGTFNETYQLQLNNLGKEHYLVSVAVTNQIGDFIIEKSVIINNSPYLNLKYPAVGQISKFSRFIYDENIRNQGLEFPVDCQFTEEYEFGYEVWEILDIRDSSIIVNYQFHDTNIRSTWHKDGDTLRIQSVNHSGILYYFAEFSEISLSNAAYENYDFHEGCYAGFVTGQYKSLNHLNNFYNDAIVFSGGCCYGFSASILINNKFELVASSSLLTEWWYSLIVTIREEL